MKDILELQNDAPSLSQGVFPWTSVMMMNSGRTNVFDNKYFTNGSHTEAAS